MTGKTLKNVNITSSVQEYRASGAKYINTCIYIYKYQLEL